MKVREYYAPIFHWLHGHSTKGTKAVAFFFTGDASTVQTIGQCTVLSSETTTNNRCFATRWQFFCCGARNLNSSARTIASAVVELGVARIIPAVLELGVGCSLLFSITLLLLILRRFWRRFGRRGLFGPWPVGCWRRRRSERCRMRRRLSFRLWCEWQ
jgi:hypothetical protein